jgi:hypothetical protein
MKGEILAYLSMHGANEPFRSTLLRYSHQGKSIDYTFGQSFEGHRFVGGRGSTIRLD